MCAVHVTIFSTGGKFHLVLNLMYLHALTQVTRSYTLLQLYDNTLCHGDNHFYITGK